ncbi:hypothetical protein B0H11DRAFT_1117990 [Mycena galericulata]|nr:hypothetical protein B0H11DRAFT_1117990 [Mycena galericulata]
MDYRHATSRPFETICLLSHTSQPIPRPIPTSSLTQLDRCRGGITVISRGPGLRNYIMISSSSVKSESLATPVAVRMRSAMGGGHEVIELLSDLDEEMLIPETQMSAVCMPSGSGGPDDCALTITVFDPFMFHFCSGAGQFWRRNSSERNGSPDFGDCASPFFINLVISYSHSRARRFLKGDRLQ